MYVSLRTTVLHDLCYQSLFLIKSLSFSLLRAYMSELFFWIYLFLMSFILFLVFSSVALVCPGIYGHNGLPHWSGENICRQRWEGHEHSPYRLNSLSCHDMSVKLKLLCWRYPYNGPSNSSSRLILSILVLLVIIIYDVVTIEYCRNCVTNKTYYYIDIYHFVIIFNCFFKLSS